MVIIGLIPAWVQSGGVTVTGTSSEMEFYSWGVTAIGGLSVAAGRLILTGRLILAGSVGAVGYGAFAFSQPFSLL